VACAKKLIETGKIPRNESIVLCITGHGLKTAEAVAEHIGAPRLINPSLREFDALLHAETMTPAAATSGHRNGTPATTPTRASELDRSSDASLV
ncbi:MAG: hypothetical protein ACAI35_06380, partial [Candidatus Methylacidiphilales bacterium]